MDIFDDVINLESKSYQEGIEKGKAKVREIVDKQSSLEGRDNGFYIAKEFGFIIGYTRIVDTEEHIREKYQKVIRTILSTNIAPDMPPETINANIVKLRSLFKQLLSSLKIKSEKASSSELY
jgi:hypothetical protein